MSDEGQPIFFDPSLPVEESLATMPAAFRLFLKTAFSFTAKVISAGKTSEFVKLMSESTSGPVSTATAKDFALQVGVEVQEIRRLFTAAAFCSAAMLQQKALTPDEFVATGVRSGIIAESDRRDVLLLTQAFAESRTYLKKTERENRLIHAVLPSLSSFRVVIDLRPAFSDDDTAIEFTVPVIIACIENDSTDDVWVQMSKNQVEKIVSDMQAILRKVQALEQWAERHSLEAAHD